MMARRPAPDTWSIGEYLDHVREVAFGNRFAIETALADPGADLVGVDGAGVTGDAQNDRRHHGRPVQAICLWSADVIERLASEGHPIAAGNAGENFTLAGIDWAALRPGSRLDIGDVPLLITAHVIPCAKNAQWFSDRDFNRILHTQNPGLSRLYAVPLRSGTVSTGDKVTVEPPSSARAARSSLACCTRSSASTSGLFEAAQ